MSWLDKYIEEQKTQREATEEVAFPFDPAKLCEIITESDEEEGAT